MKNLLTIFCILLVACDIARIELQSIEIDQYPDNARNAKLAEDLIYYDPQYFAYKMPAFNEDTLRGIQIGHSASPEGEKSSIRIRYNRNNQAVLASISELRSQFDTFFPQLAAAHASKDDLFANLSPVGISWLRRLFTDDPENLLAEGSQEFRDSTGVDEFSSGVEEMERTYGQLEDFSFVRAQYYEPFSQYSETINLWYQVDTSNQVRILIVLKWQRWEDEWLIAGFDVWSQPE